MKITLMIEIIKMEKYVCVGNACLVVKVWDPPMLAALFDALQKDSPNSWRNYLKPKNLVTSMKN